MREFPPADGLSLVVGSKVYAGRKDRRALYAKAVGIDLEAGPGVDIVSNLETTPSKVLYDHIDCVSVLEHSKAPWLLAAGIENALRAGGTLLLSVPWVWRFHGYPSDYWRFTPEGVRVLFPRIAWKALRLASNAEWQKKNWALPSLMSGDSVYFGRSELIGIGVRTCES